MARRLRVEFEDAIYHLCARGNARQAIFQDEHDRARFVELLRESAQRFESAVLCFVLMGNHFHLVAQTHRPNLRRWMPEILEDKQSVGSLGAFRRTTDRNLE